MGLLTSPSPASTLFQQSNAPTRTASLSENQLGRFDGGPSRGSVNIQSTSRPLANLENGGTIPQSSNGLESWLVNGDAEHVASSESYDRSFKPQNVSRARTESHQALVHRPRAPMIRSKTNYEPQKISTTTETNVEEHGELRHGWEDEYNSTEFLGQLNSVLLNMMLANLHHMVG